jgi:hypothetical protein
LANSGGVLRNQVNVQSKIAEIDGDVFALNEPPLSQIFEKSKCCGRIARKWQQHTEAIRPPRFLRNCKKWPRDSRAK